jgi:hypothetical protein
MIKRFTNWFHNFFKKEKLYKSKFVTDLPDQLNPNIIYLVHNNGYTWQAVMICPCGCNKILNMNLMKEHHPSWKVELDKKKLVTFHPSINRMVGCKSHFFIKKGQVSWA